MYRKNYEISFAGDIFEYCTTPSRPCTNEEHDGSIAPNTSSKGKMLSYRECAVRFVNTKMTQIRDSSTLSLKK